jgi:6-phosphofructokinase 1
MADRILAVKLATRAVDLLLKNKTNRVVGIKNNEIIDMGISEALSIPRVFDEKLHELAHILSL